MFKFDEEGYRHAAKNFSLASVRAGEGEGNMSEEEILKFSKELVKEAIETYGREIIPFLSPDLQELVDKE